MLFPRRIATFAAALLTVLTLAACESSEERAEGHYQSALALIEDGDTDRALVELRNVFQLNGTHREARKTYARLQRERGDEGAAYGQYLRLVEQYPEDEEGLKALSEIAIDRMDWESAKRFVPRAYEQDPEDISLRAMQTLIEYRDARAEEDDEAAADAISAANEILKEDPGQNSVRQVLLDQLLRDENYSSALEIVDSLLADEPQNISFHEIKLRILGTLQDMDAFGTHLEEMIALFPENEQIRGMLVSFYIDQDRLESAENFLRDLAENADPKERENAEATLVSLLQQTKGIDAAITELDRLIGAQEEDLFHRTLRAALMFEQGQADQAITDLRTAIEGQEPSIQLNDSKSALARMLLATGDEVGARALVEEVLAADESHVGALQMRAAWQIDDDKPGEAVQTLRNALDQDPRNARTLTLIAQAHLREGNRELAGERLSLAVEVSNNAPEESLRYASFLIEMNRLQGAEQVLVSALRRNGTSVPLLTGLGNLYMRQADWVRAESAIRQLREMETEAAIDAANTLQSDLLMRQNRTDESITFLQGLIETGDANTGASALVVRNMLRDGDLQGAEAYIEDLLAESPEDRDLQFVRAGLHVAAGEIDAAETIYRDLMAAAPRSPAPVMSLVATMRQTNRPDEAMAVLDEGIENTGGAPQLRAIKAGLLEAEGDIEGAITIYEDLYSQNSGNLIVANNLASLISAHRQDDESLQRAAAVAQRLRGTDIPAFQDTYGWIEFRRGNTDVAIEYLEPAAQALSGDPMVQMHLGLAYAGAERYEDARAALTRALDIAGETPLPALSKAREALEALPEPSSQPEAPSETTPEDN